MGTGHATSPSWPTHSTGDLGLLWVTSDTAVPTAPTGWTQVPGATVKGSSNTIAIAVFYKTATSNAESAPTLAGGGTSLWGTIITVSAGTFHVPRPITSVGVDYTTGGTTSGFFAGCGTFVADNLIIQGQAWATNSAGPLSSGETNSTLSSLTEQYDAGSASLGGMVIISGTKASAGTVDPTTNTLGSSTIFATITLAIQPPQAGLGVAKSRAVNV